MIGGCTADSRDTVILSRVDSCDGEGVFEEDRIGHGCGASTAEKKRRKDRTINRMTEFERV